MFSFTAKTRKIFLILGLICIAINLAALFFVFITPDWLMSGTETATITLEILHTAAKFTSPGMLIFMLFYTLSKDKKQEGSR
jgi:hypothetical protein